MRRFTARRFCRNLAVLPSFVVKVPFCPIQRSAKCKLHSNQCITVQPQVAHSAVQTAPEETFRDNSGAICWGFQQVSPRYGVLSLDAPLRTSLELSQLARRNLRSGKRLQRPRGEATLPVNQPPLANASRCGALNETCADGWNLGKSRAQRVVFGSPGLYALPAIAVRGFRTEMTSNCNSRLDLDLPEAGFCVKGASTSPGGLGLPDSQGVTSC